ncbi:hypothetical protein BuS5_00514 [Desulfosarcina sp. BuS5]|uniref:hypothetical protein n=1 Tax=Desulfosarcina sp. BuS5 TaxID=933262 RepID=UPI000484A03D|nr:hypothetical protein [Desulfosarcina sp. BuS5]WDN87546.1 hypothetical protein BuS5_00514 [Desulfosarcina sp. BuS5]
MLIKTDIFELEIFQNSNVYLGSKKSGQIFTNWADLDDSVKVDLVDISRQVETLMLQTEKLLYTPGCA